MTGNAAPGRRYFCSLIKKRMVGVARYLNTWLVFWNPMASTTAATGTMFFLQGKSFLKGSLAKKESKYLGFDLKVINLVYKVK